VLQASDQHRYEEHRHHLKRVLLPPLQFFSKNLQEFSPLYLPDNTQIRNQREQGNLSGGPGHN
jgi:hypothetical protein